MHILTPSAPHSLSYPTTKRTATNPLIFSALGPCSMGGTILLYGVRDYPEHDDMRFAKMGMRHRCVKMVCVGRKRNGRGGREVVHSA